jgi:hypothetical protein
LNSVTPSDSVRSLTIYLNDHRAGAAAGTAVARRLWRKNRSGPWESQLKELHKAIDADRATLDAVRRAVGATGGELGRLAALTFERASRLKPNGRLVGYSPLSRVLELEMLISGVQSKLRLWRALHLTTATHPDLGPFDFVALAEQAAEQLETLSQIHEWAVTQAVSTFV